MSTSQKKKRASTENRFKALQQIESSHWVISCFKVQYVKEHYFHMAFTCK